MTQLTLRNQTDYIAQFLVLDGGQMIAPTPGIPPGAQVAVPTTSIYQVTATTVIEGNTYASAPLDVSGATGFLAQVLQVQSQGTYEFNVAQVVSSNSG